MGLTYSWYPGYVVGKEITRMLSQDTLPLPGRGRPPAGGATASNKPLGAMPKAPSPTASSATLALLQRVLTGRAAPSALSAPAMPASRLVRTPVGLRSVALAGEGGPTVVFESGLGQGKEAWAAVFQAVAGHARALAYDRGGYGDSEAAPGPRDGQQAVQELRALLQTLELPPPYVLVGHSLGGTLMKLFARLYPHEVAGVVLVDARDSDFSKRARHMGVRRMWYEPPKALYWLARAATRRELRAMPYTMQQARRAGPFPTVPLIVLTHSRAATHWPLTLGRAWLHSQHSMARLSALGRIAVCDDAGHHLHRDRPEVVMEAVLSVLEAARYLQAKRRVSVQHPASVVSP